jgi:hypothetical protein
MAVTFKLYASNGSTLLYTFPVVFEANYPHTEKKVIEHESVRSKGSIIVDGGESSWDLVIKGVFLSTDYNAMITAIAAMESAVALNTAYYIKITDGVTTYSYKVKRIVPIEYETGSLKTTASEYQVILRVNCW